MRIHFDGTTYEVTSVHEYGYLHMLELDDGTEWYIARNHGHAGEAARQYWEDMIDNDPEEFRCIVGEEALLAWCLGQSHAVGSVPCSSLDEWLDLTESVPEEQWASYDGVEIEGAHLSLSLMRELGWEDGDVFERRGLCQYVTLYRHN
jgi:hypothetical protein